MKNFLLLFISVSIFACGGNEETVSETTNETIQTTPDSVAMAPAFIDFKAYVDKLEKKVENVDSALAKYENLRVGFTQDEKDSAFFVIHAFMQSFEISDEEMGELSEESQKKMENKYGKHGFVIWYEEGYPYPMSDMKFLEKKFKKDMSVELYDYVLVLKKTFKQTTSDAGLSIEWTELADMIITCEDYLTENPETKYSEKVLSLYMERMNFLMWGLDNTPIIDYWTDETQKQLNADVNAVYQKLIKDDKHKTGKIISDHVEFLTSKNYEYTYEEIQYLTTAEAKMYLGID